ncbi:hypothetical protein LTR66_002031 [Elasticomyces elasticus]|nr:hypothetical protein LTR66_002031 [Elasticomyces elasticus]KAK5006387.1 hypothetical protein LTR28_006562 [Elasticomyces elasticus]
MSKPNPSNTIKRKSSDTTEYTPEQKRVRLDACTPGISPSHKQPINPVSSNNKYHSIQAKRKALEHEVSEEVAAPPQKNLKSSGRLVSPPQNKLRSSLKATVLTVEKSKALNKTVAKTQKKAVHIQVDGVIVSPCAESPPQKKKRLSGKTKSRTPDQTTIPAFPKPPRSASQPQPHAAKDPTRHGAPPPRPDLTDPRTVEVIKLRFNDAIQPENSGYLHAFSNRHLAVVMDEYIKETGREDEFLCFVFDGRQIWETQTPNQVGLRQENTIEVVRVDADGNALSMERIAEYNADKEQEDQLLAELEAAMAEDDEIEEDVSEGAEKEKTSERFEVNTDDVVDQESEEEEVDEEHLREIEKTQADIADLQARLTALQSEVENERSAKAKKAKKARGSKKSKASPAELLFPEEEESNTSLAKLLFPEDEE